jgi:hypothetical protein
MKDILRKLADKAENASDPRFAVILFTSCLSVGRSSFNRCEDFVVEIEHLAIGLNSFTESDTRGIAERPLLRCSMDRFQQVRVLDQ